MVAIVGYTNAGKSTPCSTTSPELASLPTTVSLIPWTPPAACSASAIRWTWWYPDTVGFIRKLPHQLVEAFKATLEELEYADLLLHVIDVSNPEWQLQAAVVENLIRELGAGELPRLMYLTSQTGYPSGRSCPTARDICAISARTGEGIDRLLEMIDQRLDKGHPGGWCSTCPMTKAAC